VSALETEVEQAFQACWTTGSVDEDWARWPEHLTEDVHYVERFFGTMHGREAVRSWITELMVVRADVHAVLDWYVVKGRRVILSMQNRYYATDPAQPHIDFAGLTVLEYAADGAVRLRGGLLGPRRRQDGVRTLHRGGGALRRAGARERAPGTAAG
jgi:hypothetical protein